MLSISLDADFVRRILSLCARAVEASEPHAWQLRQQAVLTVATMAAALRMEDPLFPGEGRLVSTPAVRLLQQERAAVMKLIERVRFDKVRVGGLSKAWGYMIFHSFLSHEVSHDLKPRSNL